MVPIPAVPAAVTSLSYQAPSPENPMITWQAIQLVGQTTLWVRIMSVLMFIGAGFMVLASLLIIFVAVATSSRRGDTPPVFLGCIYIPMAILYIIPAIFLWRYATNTKAFASLRQIQYLEAALQAQKSFWKFVAITALIMIGLYLLVIVLAIIVAVAARP